jgi:hypothetical protein
MEDICMLLEGSATEEQYTQLLHLVQEQLASTKGNFSTVLKTLSADVEKVGMLVCVLMLIYTVITQLATDA